MNLVTHLTAFAVCLQALEMLALRRCSLLAGATLLAALIALAYPHPAPLAFMLVGTWGTAWLYRGTFNGGSDSMTVLLLLACLIAVTAPETADGMRLFTALLLTWTYVVAGMAKLLNREWRSGRALREIVETSPFSYERCLPVPARVAAWAVIAFECGFPLAFWVPLPFLVAGVIFHALNVYYFGLNRFFWIWLAAYPALFLTSAARV